MSNKTIEKSIRGISYLIQSNKIVSSMDISDS
jgi:hypothetical protein